MPEVYHCLAVNVKRLLYYLFLLSNDLISVTNMKFCLHLSLDVAILVFRQIYFVDFSFSQHPCLLLYMCVCECVSVCVCYLLRNRICRVAQIKKNCLYKIEYFLSFFSLTFIFMSNFGILFALRISSKTESKHCYCHQIGSYVRPFGCHI